MSKEYNLSVQTVGQLYHNMLGEECVIGLKIPETDIVISATGVLQSVKFNCKGGLVFVLDTPYGIREESFYSTKVYSVEFVDNFTARFRMENYTDKEVYIEVQLPKGGYERALAYLKNGYWISQRGIQDKHTNEYASSRMDKKLISVS